MHIDFTFAVVLYVIAAILFIAAAVVPGRFNPLLCAGLALFALAHIVH